MDLERAIQVAVVRLDMAIMDIIPIVILILVGIVAVAGGMFIMWLLSKR